ncbi:MAG: GCN5-related N-acetyltransferase [Paenibacillus sp.]|nr:GCN5-related N-acetyltransferase [Paenibacillus sp.]
MALVQMNLPAAQSYLRVIVDPQVRRQGIGSAVAAYAEAQLRAGGAAKVRSSFRAGLRASIAFARKHGYDSYFASTFMQRTGEPFPVEELLPVRPYTDADHTATQSLYATAFHEMRVRVGCFPVSVVASRASKNEGHGTSTRKPAWLSANRKNHV